MEASVLKSITPGKRLGIMGGTFDPIHYGHMVAAETARIELGLEAVLFIPTGIPPHKIDHQVTDARLRLEMVEMSIRSNTHFKVSAMEIEREGPTYTIDTLRTLHQLLPEKELFFVTGADALRDLFAWHEPEEIVKLAKIIGASRPGYNSRELSAGIYQQYPFTRDRISLLEVPALAISSTDIRARVRNHKSIRYLLPDEVRLFIKTNQIYQ